MIENADRSPFQHLPIEGRILGFRFEAANFYLPPNFRVDKSKICGVLFTNIYGPFDDRARIRRELFD